MKLLLDKWKILNPNWVGGNSYAPIPLTYTLIPHTTQSTALPNETLMIDIPASAKKK